jgi:hypothetical protein
VEVSSWRFRRAQTVSGPPTFSRSIDISPGVEISTPAKILSSAYISARHQHFVNPPIFPESTNIFEIRQHFGNPPIFWRSANILESANILKIRQYFGNPPTFSKSAYFSARRQYFTDLLDFCCCKYCVYFQYLFMHLSMRQYFLAQLF